MTKLFLLAIVMFGGVCAWAQEAASVKTAPAKKAAAKDPYPGEHMPRTEAMELPLRQAWVELRAGLEDMKAQNPQAVADLAKKAMDAYHELKWWSPKEAAGWNSLFGLPFKVGWWSDDLPIILPEYLTQNKNKVSEEDNQALAAWFKELKEDYRTAKSKEASRQVKLKYQQEPLPMAQTLVPVDTPAPSKSKKKSRR